MHLFAHCIKCNKTRKYNCAKGNSCSKCKKDFLFQCGICSKHYKTIKLLIHHITYVCKKKLNYSCADCQYRTNTKQSITSHIRSMHLPRDPNSNKCKKCGKNYSKREHLRTHMKTCGKSEEFKRSLKHYTCDHCQHKSYTKGHLANHIKAKHLPKQLSENKCSKCGKVYTNRASLTIHSEFCGKSEELKRSLMKFSCDLCQYKAKNKTHLLRHIEMNHLPRDPNSNKCNKCGKSYKNYSSLHRHSKQCGKPRDVVYPPESRRFSCDYCEYKAIFKANLVAHIQAKHLPRDSKSKKRGKSGKSSLGKPKPQRQSKNVNKQNKNSKAR